MTTKTGPSVERPLLSRHRDHPFDEDRDGSRRRFLTAVMPGRLSSSATWCNINLNTATVGWMSLPSLGVNGMSDDVNTKYRKASAGDFFPVSSSKEAVTTHQTSEKNQLRGDKTRFALVVSHPIQHFTPFYRALAQCEGITLKVFFCCRVGLSLTSITKWALRSLGTWIFCRAMTTCSCQKPRGSLVRAHSKSATRVLARSLQSSTPKSY